MTRAPLSNTAIWCSLSPNTRLDAAGIRDRLHPGTKTLIVEMQIPSPGALPTLKEVKYVQAKDTFDEIHLPEGKLNALYDSLVYQIVLRTVHELFEADVPMCSTA